MKRLFILKGLGAGGTETYLLRFLRQYGCKAEDYVLCTSGKGGELESYFCDVARVITDIPLPLFPSFQHICFLRFVIRERFSVVCDFSGNFSAWTLLCSAIANVPIRVAFYRESRNQFKPSFLKNIYARLMAHLTMVISTRVLANSKEALLHFYPHSDGAKTNVIYNGIDVSNISRCNSADIRHKLEIPIDAYVIGHVGRYTEAKNHKMIISCALKLCREFSDVYFILVGRDVDIHFQSEIEKLGFTKRIKFLGYRTDVLDLLPALNLFYFPSLNEGQPNALIEAMLTGIPILASDIPSIRETTPKIIHQYLVPPTQFPLQYQALCDYYHNRHPLFVEECRQWARYNFNSDKQFQLFNSILK